MFTTEILLTAFTRSNGEKSNLNSAQTKTPGRASFPSEFSLVLHFPAVDPPERRSSSPESISGVWNNLGDPSNPLHFQIPSTFKSLPPKPFHDCQRVPGKPLPPSFWPTFLLNVFLPIFSCIYCTFGFPCPLSSPFWTQQPEPGCPSPHDAKQEGTAPSFLLFSC